jgi:phage shock protein A
MNYFSRLTDIVTCNLSEMLAREADPAVSLAKIIAEMEEGLAGARRSVGTATGNEERLRKEIEELGGHSEQLTDEARSALRNHDESAARVALIRKQEVVDVVAGLQQQHKAACATRDHLNTTLRALEARLSEARRRAQELQTSAKAAAPSGRSAGAILEEDDPRSRAVDDELAALKRELTGL